jgi:hypothetical protein
MKTFFAFAVSLLLFAPLLSAQEGRPVLVVSHYAESNSRGFLKWDCPVFAAYADGSIIWRKEWRCSLAALARTTDPHAQELVKRALATVGHYSGRRFVLTNSSDPDITTLSSGDATVTILGDWMKPRVIDNEIEGDTPDLEKVNQREKALWDALPNEVRLVLSELRSFDALSYTLWRPVRLNVLLQPPIKTDLKAIAWPSSWPQSFGPVRGSSHMKTIDLPGGMLDEILALVPDDQAPKIIRVGEEARYGELRLIFPGEESERRNEDGGH